jgi:hypothetical protein
MLRMKRYTKFNPKELILAIHHMLPVSVCVWGEMWITGAHTYSTSLLDVHVELQLDVLFASLDIVPFLFNLWGKKEHKLYLL